jgi:hypothetical protein
MKGRVWFADGNNRITSIVQPLHVLLSECCLDEIAQASDELPEELLAIAELLDLAPRDFHTLVIVAPCIPAMRKTHSSPGLCPKVSARVRGNLISVVRAKMIDQ